jgi:hypothetical protein
MAEPNTPPAAYDVIRVEADNMPALAAWVQATMVAEVGDLLVRDAHGVIRVYTPRTGTHVMTPTPAAPSRR